MTRRTRSAVMAVSVLLALDEDKAAAAAVFLVEGEYGVAGGAGARRRSPGRWSPCRWRDADDPVEQFSDDGLGVMKTSPEVSGSPVSETYLALSSILRRDQPPCHVHKGLWHPALS